jgi:20S proteasome subunit alpha 1
LYKIDPSGQSIGFKATASGPKEQEAHTQLEKQFKKNEGQWSTQETAEVAIRVLQTVVSTDFKANEIEVGFCTIDQPKFRKLTEEEIDAVLNTIAEAN